MIEISGEAYFLIIFIAFAAGVLFMHGLHLIFGGR